MRRQILASSNYDHVSIISVRTDKVIEYSDVTGYVEINGRAIFYYPSVISPRVRVSIPLQHFIVDCWNDKEVSDNV